jgi:CheY-like chemotaxis protein
MTRVLVVDGAVPALALERSFLHRSGCEVLAATRGDALGRARQYVPDLVLIDAGAPEDRALDLGLRLGADPVIGRTPVVYVGPPELEGRCAAACAWGFVPRPVSRGVLVGTLRRFLPVDERSSRRLPSALPVAFAGGGTGGVSYTRDVSTTGLFLRTARPLDVGTRVRLHVRLHPEDAAPLRTEGLVVRRVAENGATGVGVRLGPLAPDDRGRLAARLAEAP